MTGTDVFCAFLVVWWYIYIIYFCVRNNNTNANAKSFHNCLKGYIVPAQHFVYRDIHCQEIKM